MHLLVAQRAVLKSRQTHVVEGGRNGPQCSVDGSCGSRQVGVAFQADEHDLGPGQHPRIGRSVRLVTSGTALERDGSVRKGKRPALVAVALKAARLVGV